MNGVKLAALYSLRPHLLGFCGPKEAARQRILIKFLQGKISQKKIRSVLRGFKGAYPYYKLIAKANRIKDPFDQRVVSAYWIGNQLLDKIKIEDLRKMIVKSFSGQGLLSEKAASMKANLISANSKPHHSFHVLAIGSVTGSVDFKNTKLKDLCRVGWGKVMKFKVKNSKLKVVVEYRPLVGERKIKFGKAIKKEILWDKEIVPKVEIGDWVSFHWDWLVWILTNKEVANLKKYTLNTLRALLPERPVKILAK